MRDLNLKEVTAVSGGFGAGWNEDPYNEERRLPKVVTTAYSPGFNHPAVSFSGGIAPVDQSQQYDDFASIEDNSLSDALNCAVMESNTDTLAELVSTAIGNMSDSNEREYGALIYQAADGSFNSTPLVRGTTVAEAGSNPPSIDFTVHANDIRDNGGTIVGIVHNHPDVGYNNAQDSDNRNPSDGDWQVFNQLIDNNYANEDLAHYILGPDGVLREFHASDESDHNGDEDPDTPDTDNEVRNGENGDCSHSQSS